MELLQRWNFIFDIPPNGIRGAGSAQPLINTVNGKIAPFIVLDYMIEDGQILYRLKPDQGYEDDPDLELDLMPELINGVWHKIAIIIEEVS